MYCGSKGGRCIYTLGLSLLPTLPSPSRSCLSPLSSSHLLPLPFPRTLSLFIKSECQRSQSASWQSQIYPSMQEEEKAGPGPQTFPASEIPATISPLSSENMGAMARRDPAGAMALLFSMIFYLLQIFQTIPIMPITVQVYGAQTYILVFHPHDTPGGGSFLRWHFREEETETQRNEMTTSLRKRHSHPVLGLPDSQSAYLRVLPGSLSWSS